MAKYKIFFEKDNKENINEQELINDIQKEEFFAWMKKNNYPFEKIKEILDNNKHISASEQSHFNLTLLKAKKEIDVSLIESIVFFEESFAKFNKIISILDGKTKFELKKELSTNFKIKLDKNSLGQILS